MIEAFGVLSLEVKLDQNLLVVILKSHFQRIKKKQRNFSSIVAAIATTQRSLKTQSSQFPNNHDLEIPKILQPGN